MVITGLLLMARIAIRTAVVFVFLIIGFRLVGKRQMGQMNIYDLAMIMLVANAVQNAMTLGKGELSVGIASAGTLMLLGILLTYIIVRKPILSHLVTGTPTVLVSNGTLIQRNMRRENVTENEILAVMREHEIKDVAQIKLAVMEVDGSISMVTQ